MLEILDPLRELNTLSVLLRMVLAMLIWRFERTGAGTQAPSGGISHPICM